LGCIHFDAIEFGSLETLCRSLEPVSSGIDCVDTKIAGAVGDRVARHAGCQMCDLNCGVRDAGTGLIFDNASDEAFAGLGHCWSSRHEGK
jgi:hypothetical protein